jgi:hypothetical protein
VTCTLQKYIHIRSREIILLDDDGNEIILPKDRQIPSDFFRKGDNVRGIIELVELRGKQAKNYSIQNFSQVPRKTI